MTISVRLLLVALALLNVRECVGQCPSADCSSDPHSHRHNPVCASDGRTYLSPCDIDCARNITIKHAGKCSTNNQLCLQQRTQALKNAASAAFVPECADDGNKWKPIQCHNGTGYCWCVGVYDGRPVPGSSVRHRNPNCDRKCKLAQLCAWNFLRLSLTSLQTTANFCSTTPIFASQRSQRIRRPSFADGNRLRAERSQSARVQLALDFQVRTRT